jgi:hypothetical protein
MIILLKVEIFAQAVFLQIYCYSMPTKESELEIGCTCILHFEEQD